MAKAVTIVFPHQLFKQHPAIASGQPIYLVEEWLFFRQYNFHQQKLVLHRASMQFYNNWLLQQGHTVQYIASTDAANDCRVLVQQLAADKVTAIHMAEPADNWLHKRMTTACQENGIALHIHTTPNFLNSPANVQGFFDGRKTYFQTDFYVAQRKQRQILLDKEGKPLGGKWTYDADNRQKFPKTAKAPVLPLPADNQYITEARQYVQQQFGNNYGSAATPCLFAVTFADADKWLTEFLQNRFALFGIYEDAMVAKEHTLYHSVLTPMLNTGLLQPQQIIEQALAVAAEKDIPLNSVEGFIRQVMGWREFIRIVYEREGSKQRTTNYWGFTRKIPPAFWTGQTGIVPIDTTIKKILQTGYCHHIERLMVLGNFMLLCEFDPDEVYRWFMELFIDAYDWVMVPNVYGMTQFADGGLMTTKPYISGSNYIMKMSDYTKGGWQTIWDGLFWHFMDKQRAFFLQNPRLGMLVGTFDKMSADKKAAHLQAAEQFLQSLDKQLVKNG